MNDITNAEPGTMVAKIADRIDGDASRSISLSGRAGGVTLDNMHTVMEFAKMMAISDIAIPRHLRGNPGACLAVSVQAYEWGITPFAAANKSYSVNDRLAYESQLIHAVVVGRAPIKGRIKSEYSGEGPKRRCKVWAVLSDAVATDPGERVEYESPEFSSINPKNSPLWKNDPDLQLFYWASRAFARRHFPDVLLGVYEREEMEAGPMKVVGDARAQAGELAATLTANRTEGVQGFDPAFVESEVAGGKTIEAQAQTSAPGSAQADPRDEPLTDHERRLAGLPPVDPFDFDGELDAFEKAIAAITSRQELLDFGSKIQGAEQGWYVAAPDHLREVAQDLFQDRLAEIDKAEAKARKDAEANAEAARKAQDEIDRQAAAQDNGAEAVESEEDRLLTAGRAAAMNGSKRLKLWFGKLKAPEFDLMKPHKENLEAAARQVDEAL